MNIFAVFILMIFQVQVIAIKFTFPWKRDRDRDKEKVKKHSLVADHDRDDPIDKKKKVHDAHIHFVPLNGGECSAPYTL
jgi:hypothetical protein